MSTTGQSASRADIAWQPVDIQHLAGVAKARLKPEVHQAISRGVSDGLTFERNLEAWRRLELAPHVLAGHPAAETKTTILGSEVATPILMAPAGLPRNAHPDGEVAAARGAAAAGTLMVLSHFATRPLEEVASAAPECARWFQIYLTKDRGYCHELLNRARENGYRAIVMTVDSGGGIALEGVQRDAEWDLQTMRGGVSPPGPTELSSQTMAVGDLTPLWPQPRRSPMWRTLSDKTLRSTLTAASGTGMTP